MPVKRFECDAAEVGRCLVCIRSNSHLEILQVCKHCSTSISGPQAQSPLCYLIWLVLIETITLFFVFPFSLALHSVPMHVKHLESQKWLPSPTENASHSALSSLVLWLCDIALHHRVTHIHNWCLVGNLACENWFSTADLQVVTGAGSGVRECFRRIQFGENRRVYTALNHVSIFWNEPENEHNISFNRKIFKLRYEGAILCECSPSTIHWLMEKKKKSQSQDKKRRS